MRRSATQPIPGGSDAATVPSCAAPPSRGASTHSHMLIDQNRVSIGIHGHETGRPCRVLVRLLLQLHPLCLQLALQHTDVGERGELLSAAVPAGIEGEEVPL